MYRTLYIYGSKCRPQCDEACIPFIALLLKMAYFKEINISLFFLLKELRVDCFNKDYHFQKGGFNEPISINIQAVLILIP